MNPCGLVFGEYSEIAKGCREMISQSADTALEVEKVQIELIRKSSVAKRISVVGSLSQTTRFLSRR